MITTFDTMPVGIFSQAEKIILTASAKSEISALEYNDYQVKLLALLSKKTEDEILGLPLDQYQKAAAALKFLETPCREVPVRTRYKVGRWRLILAKDVTKWTAAQFIDFQQYKNAGDLAGVLSCCMVPKGHKYNSGYDPAEVRTAIEGGIMVPAAHAVSAFFLRKYTHSLRNIITCSEREAVILLPTWRDRINLIRRARTAKRFLRSGAGSGTSSTSRN